MLELIARRDARFKTALIRRIHFVLYLQSRDQRFKSSISRVKFERCAELVKQPIKDFTTGLKSSKLISQSHRLKLQTLISAISGYQIMPVVERHAPPKSYT